MALGCCSSSRQLTSVSFNHDQNLSTCLNRGLLVAAPQPHSQARDDGPGKHQPHDSHMRSFFISLFQMFIIDFIFQGTDRQTTRGRADNGRGIVYFSLNSCRQRIKTSLPRLWLTSRRNLSRQSRRNDKFRRNPRPRLLAACVCVCLRRERNPFFFRQIVFRITTPTCRTPL